MRLTFVLAFLLASFGASIGSVLAADTHIHASVTFKKALSASVGNDMDFGIITYELNHGGTVTLGTNGAVQLENGSNGLSLSGGAPHAADVTLSGDDQSTVEVSCETTGTLKNGNSDSLALKNIEIAIETGLAPGNGLACSGLNVTTASIDLGSTPSPKIYLGGAVDVANNAIQNGGAYSTVQAGADPITIRVVYQ